MPRRRFSLAGDEGLCFDISPVLHPEVLAMTIRTFGTKRILFGSDKPILYPGGRQEWRGDRSFDYTNSPFHFTRDRQAPAVEVGHTLGLV